MKHVRLGALFLIFQIIFLISGGLSDARTVKDTLDREVQLPDKIQRVVSLAPSITESVFAIGQGDKLVGATQYSDYPAQARKLPSIGSYVNLNVEKIISLRPDLCLATKDGNPYQVVQQLERADIPVYALDPRDMPAIMDTLTDLGRLLDAQAQAEQVVKTMQRQVAALRRMGDRAEHRPKVFFQIGISPIVSVGSDTFIHELISIAGGENVAAGSVQYPRYSREDVLVADPDVILINSMSKDEDLVQAEIKKWKAFPQIDAVRSERIHPLDASLFNRPTPRLVEALRILVHLFHPQVLDKEEMMPVSSGSGDGNG
ncbi:ABC transporter substrate-binding protein [Desulfovermiculus halophilus]|jgi:iron complex transport system substrate-binding protein|uniref:ABC transporter substrate-binding protein n=1 Tax=Desulfovermiculus halophilus TaxID=339722 RepID=UPI0006879131|nr:cobalamin-binding protein [Desulfovermiculus halophilus]